MQLVLASGSPRRRLLLEQIGLTPIVRPADIDETPRPHEAPADYVLRLAGEKADAVPRSPGELVVGADTTVAIGASILAKPVDADDARTHLTMLSGRTHDVFTGVAVVVEDRRAVGVAHTTVEFAALTPSEIERYVASGEPLDKAGSYAIQGGAGAFVREIRGSFDNVIGLPRRRLIELCAELGVDLHHVGAH